MKTDEVCDRPLETFGAVSPMFLDLFCCNGNRFPVTGLSRYKKARLQNLRARFSLLIVHC